MTTFSYTSGDPTHIVGGATINLADISGSFADVATFLNGGNIDATNLATSADPATLMGAYRTVSEATCGSNATLTSGVYVLCGSGAELNKSPASVTAADPLLFYLDGADYAVSGLTAKVRVRGTVFTNGTAPAITFTFGLYPVTMSNTPGVTVTTGTVTTGSTAAVVSPGANAATSAVSTDISIPTAGAYTLGVAASGSTAANANVVVQARLDLRHV